VGCRKLTLGCKSSFVGVAGEAVAVVVRNALRLVWVLDYYIRRVLEYFRRRILESISGGNWSTVHSAGQDRSHGKRSKSIAKL
jgi:hypothetical protein